MEVWICNSKWGWWAIARWQLVYQSVVLWRPHATHLRTQKRGMLLRDFVLVRPVERECFNNTIRPIVRRKGSLRRKLHLIRAKGNRNNRCLITLSKSGSLIIRVFEGWLEVVQCPKGVEDGICKSKWEHVVGREVTSWVQCGIRPMTFARKPLLRLMKLFCAICEYLNSCGVTGRKNP